MSALAACMAQHWHAVERDLIHLGKDELFDRGELPLSKLASIVLAAPPTTAVHYAQTRGWTPEAALLASQMEQNAGLVPPLAQRIPRNGEAPQQQPAPPPGPPKPANPRRIDSWDSMSIEEFERLRAANYAKGESPSRVIGPEKKGTA